MGILVAGTDGSPHAQAAVVEAIDLARRLDEAILFVAVSPPAPDYLGRPLWQAWVTEHHGRAREALDAARAAAEQAGVEAEYELLEGEPAETLAKLAETRDADLLVIGTRGLGAIRGVLLGSVAIALIRRSHRPVVLVREPVERAREEAEERAGVRAHPATAST
jgi:nucleotide-binding universal stress UspA family protein